MYVCWHNRRFGTYKIKKIYNIYVSSMIMFSNHHLVPTLIFCIIFLKSLSSYNNYVFGWMLPSCCLIVISLICPSYILNSSAACFAKTNRLPLALQSIYSLFNVLSILRLTIYIHQLVHSTHHPLLCQCSTHRGQHYSTRASLKSTWTSFSSSIHPHPALNTFTNPPQSYRSKFRKTILFGLD